MPLPSLSRAYRVAPRGGAAWSPPEAGERDARRDRRDEASGADAEPGCDSVRHSPLLRALLRALHLPAAAAGAHDGIVERALIAFARALNLATGDADPAPQPAMARASDAAQRRARNEEQLLAAFSELQHAAGRPRPATREALQAQLTDTLHALARELHVDGDRAGEATQPGSLISVRA
ncbi:MAG: hypothetical protein U1E90_03410 [Burkholderiaceae bacterium]